LLPETELSVALPVAPSSYSIPFWAMADVDPAPVTTVWSMSPVESAPLIAIPFFWYVSMVSRLRLT
jgi:hypothetical protein